MLPAVQTWSAHADSEPLQKRMTPITIGRQTSGPVALSTDTTKKFNPMREKTKVGPARKADEISGNFA
jgi:hypothetical protein